MVLIKKTKPCNFCEKDFAYKHFNQKKCPACLTRSKKIGPCPKTTRKEIDLIRRLSRDYFKKDIAKMLNSTWSRIGRIKHWHGIEERARDYPRDLVKRVSEYYATHGKRKTVERFPEVNVKALERYFSQYGKPRQIRWQSHQHRMLAQMGGLISPSKQAKVFKRPRAFAGSIKSYWMKKQGHAGSHVNGLPMHLARPFLPLKYQCGLIDFMRQPQVNENQSKSWRIVLWTDLAKYCKPTTPEHIQKAFRTMARFQQWLHGTANVRLKIKKMMRSTPDQLSKLLKV